MLATKELWGVWNCCELYAERKVSTDFFYIPDSFFQYWLIFSIINWLFTNSWFFFFNSADGVTRASFHYFLSPVCRSMLVMLSWWKTTKSGSLQSGSVKRHLKFLHISRVTTRMLRRWCGNPFLNRFKAVHFTMLQSQASLVILLLTWKNWGLQLVSFFGSTRIVKIFVLNPLIIVEAAREYFWQILRTVLENPKWLGQFWQYGKKSLANLNIYLSQQYFFNYHWNFNVDSLKRGRTFAKKLLIGRKLGIRSFFNKTRQCSKRHFSQYFCLF